MPLLVELLEPSYPPSPPAGCQVVCPRTCDWTFSRLRIFPAASGGVQVQWSLHPRFQEPGPYDFKLQWGLTGNPEATDWQDVTGWLPDTFTAVDETGRMFGRFQFSHYRVLVRTSGGTVASPPQLASSDLSLRDWNTARSLLRQEAVRLRNGRAGAEGYLLKRRLSGNFCSCVDEQTKVCRNPQHLDCFGTGILGGYFSAIPCYYVEVRPGGFRSHQSATGTTNEGPTVAARMINVPQVFSYDVWVNRAAGSRWAVHSVKTAVEIRGVPLILDPVELRLLPFGHVVYQFPLE